MFILCNQSIYTEINLHHPQCSRFCIHILSVANNTADINNFITEIKAVLSELHNKREKVSVKTKQILLSAISAVDHNGNITNTNFNKYIHPKCKIKLNHVKSSTIVKTTF